MAVHNQGHEQEQSHIPVRLNILFFIVFVFFAILILRLAIVQLVHGDEYRAMSEDTQIKTISITAPRGFIKDRNGTPLVTNEAVYTITYLKDNDSNIDKETVAQRLSPHISMTVEDIIKEMEAPGYGYVPKRIKSGLDEKQVAWISENAAHLPGVEVVVEMVRDYRFVETAAHVLGYTRPISAKDIEYYKQLGYQGIERVGRAGIENVYEDELRGKDGQIQVEVNSHIQIVNKLETINPVRGNDLVLTLDIELQKKIEKAVVDSLEQIRTRENDPKPNANQAAVVVMKPKTGEVLAMVSYPEYDPTIFNAPSVPPSIYNEFAKKEMNLAIAGTYAPGSTVKPLTIMLGLQEGLITKQHTVYDPGYLYVGYEGGKPKPKYNWKRSGHGRVDIRRALGVSNNTYMYDIAMRLANWPDSSSLYKQKFATFDYYNQMFGLGVKTGIDLPFEATKYDAKEILLGKLADAAIGQYDSYTPIQLANFISTIANDGVRVRPHLLKEIQKGGVRPEDPGTTVSTRQTEIMDRVDIDPEYIKIVQEGMAMVTDPGGTGYGVLGNLPVKVAAKTGTAQTGSGQQDNSLIVGYAPYEDPEIAFVVVIPGGGGGSTGGGLVARDIVRTYFGLDKDDPVTEEAAAQDGSPAIANTTEQASETPAATE